MKKNILIIVFLFSAFQSVNAKDFLITDFGAVRNQNSTVSVQKTIDACFAEGGGRVVVPPGTFIIGAIILKSNIHLYLEQGSELQSSQNMDDFLIGTKRYGMIFCEDATNVSITGKGVINGMGSKFYEADQNHTNSAGLGQTKEYDKMLIRQKEKYLPEGVFFTDGPIKRKPRPGMTVVFFHCNQVTIKDITVKDTPIWAVRFSYSEDVLVDGITLANNLMIPNSDGIHITISRNVRISNCDIVAGDDAIIVTGFARIENTPGFTSAEQDKYKYGNKSIYAENIQVTNCRLQSRSSAIRIGYGQHPIRRMVFSNIIISESNRGIGIYAHDASNIEELIFSDITIETRIHNGGWWGKGEPIHLSAISRFPGQPVGQIKDVQFNNITSVGGQGILVYGDVKSPMENIQFNNVKLNLKNGPETLGYGGNFDLRPTAFLEKQIFQHDIPGLYARYVNNLSIRNFNLSWGKDLPSFFTNGIQCLEVKNLNLKDYVGTGNPNSPNSKSLVLEKTTVRKETIY